MPSATTTLEGLSTAQLRIAASNRITHREIDDWVEKGLLPPRPASGRWPIETRQLVLDIVDAAKQARDLHRRVVLLRGDFTRFPVPPGKLREAMAHIAPTIRAPKRKMQRLLRALEAWAEREGLSQTRAQFTMQGGWVQPPLGAAPVWQPPLPENWAALILDQELLSDDAFGGRATAQYWMARILEAADDPAHDLSAIPFEERVVMLIVRDLARARAGADVPRVRRLLG